VTEKPLRLPDLVEVVYDDERWNLLKKYRKYAQRILEALQQQGIDAVVHGSVARGDVDGNSDVDVFIAVPPSSFQIETALEQAKISSVARTVIQATPAYAMKGYIEVDSATTVSFPLMTMRRVEREFYKFSGEATLAQINTGIRVLGVDKRLMLIEPTEKGHLESIVIGKEEEVSRKLGIAVQTVRDRVRTLMRRDAVGRTGVFVKRDLCSEETFELVLKRLTDDNPAVRRRLRNTPK
jgi:predicted nucleotidyltransferase